MVRIRLRRMGAKKQPHYRVVVADQQSPRDGRHIEVIGYYNPRTEPNTVHIDEGRALYWLSQGAQPSKVVAHMLKKQGTLERYNRLKAGESLEALVAEYETEAVAGEQPIQPEPAPAVAAAPVEEVETEPAEPDEDEAETEEA
jgi:small subunit ribosomal protein S16